MPVVIGSGCLIPPPPPPHLNTGYAPAYIQPISQLDLPPSVPSSYFRTEISFLNDSAYWSHTESVDDKN